jgi:hypothetical protein
MFILSILPLDRVLVALIEKFGGAAVKILRGTATTNRMLVFSKTQCAPEK